MCFILNSQYDLRGNFFQNTKKIGLKSGISQIQHDLRANSSQNAEKTGLKSRIFQIQHDLKADSYQNADIVCYIHIFLSPKILMLCSHIFGIHTDTTQ